MIYPTKFSVMFNTRSRKSSVRVFVNNEKIVSMDYMLITPFDAINGPVFDKDIVLIDDDERFRVVSYDENEGKYIAYIPGNIEDFVVMSKSHSYEIAGNTYEDKEYLSPSHAADAPVEHKEEPVGEQPAKSSKRKKKKRKSSPENSSVQTVHNEDAEQKSDGPSNDVKEESSVPIEAKEEPKESIFVNKGKQVSVSIKLAAKCDGDTGVFSYMVAREDKKEIMSGMLKKTNKKRVLIQGIIDSLNNFDGSFNINIQFVEPYVVHPFIKGWVEKWKSSNWTKESGDKIQNSELWEELYTLSKKYKIKWEVLQVADSDFDELSSMNDSIIKSL